MRRKITPRQQATVDTRVQGFDTAIQHLGEACHLRHFGHRQALVRQQFGRAPGGEQLDATGVQSLREFDDAGFVRDRK